MSSPATDCTYSTWTLALDVTFSLAPETRDITSYIIACAPTSIFPSFFAFSLLLPAPEPSLELVGLGVLFPCGANPLSLTLTLLVAIAATISARTQGVFIGAAILLQPTVTLWSVVSILALLGVSSNVSDRISHSYSDGRAFRSLLFTISCAIW